MKNTLENKAKFFAQYWGQNILRYEPDLGYHRIVNDYKIGNADEFVAELKPLSQITDEDAIEVAKIFYWNHYSDESKVAQVKKFLAEYLNYHSTNISPTEYFQLTDYLRSKGYALPYMGISVEQQIEWGWVKIKQQ